MTIVDVFGGRQLLPWQVELLESPAWIKAAFGWYGSAKTTGGALEVLAHAARNPWTSEWGDARPTTYILGLSWSTLERSGGDALEQVIPKRLVELSSRGRIVWGRPPKIRLTWGHELAFQSVGRGAVFEGVNATGIWLDEAHLLKAELWPNIQARARVLRAASRLVMVTGLPWSGWLQDAFARPEHLSDPDRFVRMVASVDNVHLPKEVLRQLRSTMGQEDAKRLDRREWIAQEGALYPEFDERIHVIDDPGRRNQTVDLAIDVGLRAAVLFLQDRQRRYRVLAPGKAVLVNDEHKRGLRLHVVDEISPENVSTEIACRMALQRGWKIVPRNNRREQVSRVFVDPRTSIDQIESIRRVLGEVEIHRKTRGQLGYDVEEGIRAVRAALVDGDGWVKLTFSRELPRTKRSVLTGMPKLRRAENGKLIKDNQTDHAAADSLRYPVAHRLPLVDQAWIVRDRL